MRECSTLLWLARFCALAAAGCGGASILGIATCSIVLATAPAGAAPLTSLLSLPGMARVESMREG